MSNALAISGVTAVLQYFLNAVYNTPPAPIGSVSVTAVAPDIVQSNLGSGSSAGPQVNLFMHQVTHNPAWRNMSLPSLASDGSTALQNPPLALDLHYLMTAYASHDTQAEALLGYGIQMLHDNPVLPRAQISFALNNLPGTNPLAGVLSGSGLADQIEMIKITPATLGREELAWLWTALKADFRPTYAFDVSVVLIQSQLATSLAFPVVIRNIQVQPVTPAQIFAAQPPTGQTAAMVGDTVTVTGQNLANTVQVGLRNQRLGIQNPPALPLTPQTVTPTSVAFVVPNLPAGLYNVWLLCGTGSNLQSTNTVPVAIAPTLSSPTVTANGGGFLVTVDCSPTLLPGQNVILTLNDTAVPAITFDSPASTVSFQFPPLAAGSYLARLQVDGVDSQIQINTSVSPPFVGPMVTVP